MGGFFRNVSKVTICDISPTGQFQDHGMTDFPEYGREVAHMHICICDDNEVLADQLLSMVKKHAPEDEHHIYTVFHSPGDLMRHLEQNSIDILLMDVLLGEENGIDWVGKLSGQHPDIAVIYVTAHADFHFPAYRTRHCCFLLKPVDEEQLREALRLAADAVLRMRETPEEYLWINEKSAIRKIPLRSIMYMESRGRAVQIHCEAGETIQINAALSHLEKKLNDHFVRCHTGFIVNFAHVREIRRTGRRCFIMHDGQLVDIAQLRYRNVLERYLNFIGERLIN